MPLLRISRTAPFTSGRCLSRTPYTREHADEWLAILRRRKEEDGRVTNWAIRAPDGAQIGGIGLHPSSRGQTHAAELGYWLCKGVVGPPAS